MKRWPDPDAIYRGLLMGAAAIVFLVIALVVYEATRGALPSLRAFGLGFLTGREWDPVAERFGAFPYIYGTLVTSAIALALALPVGVGSAVFLSEVAVR